MICCNLLARKSIDPFLSEFSLILFEISSESGYISVISIEGAKQKCFLP